MKRDREEDGADEGASSLAEKAFRLVESEMSRFRQHLQAASASTEENFKRLENSVRDVQSSLFGLRVADANGPDVVHLSVGGQTFAVAKSALLRFPSSALTVDVLHKHSELWARHKSKHNGSPAATQPLSLEQSPPHQQQQQQQQQHTQQQDTGNLDLSSAAHPPNANATSGAAAAGGASPTFSAPVVYIDRSPAVFEFILDFMRGHDIVGRALRLDDVSLVQLHEDAVFYGLPELSEILGDTRPGPRWKICPTINGQVSLDGLTLTKRDEQGMKGCISIGSEGWNAGVHEYTCTFLSSGAHIGVGVSREGIHETDLRKNVHLFYALDCGNGRAIGVGGVAKQCFDKISPTGFPPRSRVSVRIDFTTKTVSFALNDVWSVGFTNIEEGTYFPYFFIGQLAKSVTVLR